MKTICLITLAGVLCAGLLTAIAADKKVLGGPKGGRLIERTEPKAEFLVEKDHTATITFYNTDLKPVTAGEQSVTLVAESKAGRTRIEFEKKGAVLVSKGKLPEGDGYNVVLQFKQTAEAKPVNLRFNLDMHVCGGCKRAEYACICGH